MEKIQFNQTANRNSELPISEVDRLADELVKEFSNPNYRSWYCKVIYAFGFAQIQDWRGRVRDSKNPATLFSKLASQALRAKETRERLYG